MGWSKPDIDLARSSIQSCIREVVSTHNDGWVSRACKHDLYMLKSWLEDEYARLPRFSDEEKWPQERLVEILRQPNR